MTASFAPDIVLLAEYIDSAAWTPNERIVELALAFAGRGRSVLMAADGADHLPALDVAGVRVWRRNKTRGQRQLQPRAFRDWADALPRLVEQRYGVRAPIVSTVWLASGDVHCPIGPSITSQAIEQVLSKLCSPPALAAFVYERAWLPRAAMLERATRTSSPQILHLPIASALPKLTEAERDAIARRVRTVLGVRADERLVVVAGTHPDQPGVEHALRALAKADSPPLVIVLPGMLAYKLRTTALDAGLSVTGSEDARHRAVCIGGTRSMGELLAAADLAVVTKPGRRMAKHCLGRFCADAVRSGVPIVAEAGSPGIELAHEDAIHIVADASDWPDAVGGASDASWLKRAKAAAWLRRDAADIGRQLDAIESAAGLS
ncbi:MAG: hypothetical protein AAF747_06700 [Planctomycetota bacterium]